MEEHANSEDLSVTDEPFNCGTLQVGLWGPHTFYLSWVSDGLQSYNWQCYRIYLLVLLVRPII